MKSITLGGEQVQPEFREARASDKTPTPPYVPIQLGQKKRHSQRLPESAGVDELGVLLPARSEKPFGSR